MTRKNWCSSTGSSAGEAPSTVAVEPLMAASGVRSSWPIMPRNSVRRRSSSSSGARSCMVTTTEATVPSSAWIGVALTRMDTLCPSGTESTISSARTVPASLISSARTNSFRASSRPSPNRQVAVSSSASTGRPGSRKGSMSRSASRLDDTGRPVRASTTITPTGVVSIRASRSARARCSCWWVWRAGLNGSNATQLPRVRLWTAAHQAGASATSLPPTDDLHVWRLNLHPIAARSCPRPWSMYAGCPVS